MADYIKREDIVNLAVMMQTHLWTREQTYNAIFCLPSEDVAPVRHGHWNVREPMPMHDIKGNLSWGNWYVCTGCGFATTAIEGAYNAVPLLPKLRCKDGW